MGLFTAIGSALGASTAVAAGATTSAAFATGLGATALAAGVGYSMYASGQKPKMEMPNMQMPTTPVAPKTEDAAKIARDKLTNRQRAVARSKSVMSNPLGIDDEANVARKKLLGS